MMDTADSPKFVELSEKLVHKTLFQNSVVTNESLLPKNKNNHLFCAHNAIYLCK
jgi:hypothetical protein